MGKIHTDACFINISLLKIFLRHSEAYIQVFSTFLFVQNTHLKEFVHLLKRVVSSPKLLKRKKHKIWNFQNSFTKPKNEHSNDEVDGKYVEDIERDKSVIKTGNQ